MTFTDAREKPLLDKSWQRVVSFDESGPSSKRQDGVDVMDLDDDDEEGEWEYSEEEELITLDLGPDSKRLVEMSQQYSIAGLESETPFLQFGNLMFKGTWDKLIGTEIILKDEIDLSRSQAEQHKLWPLPATETDRKIGRAPSTTRKRILFKQAVNMAAREASLIPPDNQASQPILWRQAPALKEAKTGLITEKGWVWVRGRGWMRKEDTILLPQKIQDHANARPVSLNQDRTAVEDVQEGDEEEDNDEENEEEEEGSNDENDQANETTTIKQEEQSIIPENQTEEQVNTSRKRGPYKKRQKLTPEEKARYALFRSLRIVKQRREGQGDVEMKDDEEEDAEVGEETNQTNLADEDEDDDEDEG